MKEEIRCHPIKIGISLDVFFFSSSKFRHTPKGMELVPWVGGPSVLAKVEEKECEQQQASISGTSEDNLINDDSMEP